MCVCVCVWCVCVLSACLERHERGGEGERERERERERGVCGSECVGGGIMRFLSVAALPQGPRRPSLHLPSSSMS